MSRAKGRSSKLRGAFSSLAIFGIALLAVVPAAAQTQPTTITMTFEGLQDGEEILNYYDGGMGSMGSGPGPSYGVVFGSGALAAISETTGGLGNFALNPSGDTIAFFLSGGGLVMNVPAGFTSGFSFYYAATQSPGTVTVYAGPNATGDILATVTLPVTGANCNNSNESYSCWSPIGVSFKGTAQSVSFAGADNGIGFDNVTLGSQTPNDGVIITTPSLANGTVGVSYSQTMTATGGVSPYTWSAKGLPQGLTIDPTGGVIGGVPATVGTFSVTVTATSTGDFAAPPSGSATYSLAISQPGPTLTSLAPSTAVAGSGGLTMQVNGTGFTDASAVVWTPSGGQTTRLPTTFQSSTVLQATVPATLLATPGTAAVAVTNSATSTSDSVTFTITAPPGPTLASLVPAAAVAGSPTLTMQVNGTNFLQTSVVQWTPRGGQPTNLATTFQSTTVLQATVPATLLVSPGSASVVVANSVTSASVPLTFTITAPLVPTLTSIVPATAVAGSPSLTMQVNGTNFVQTSVVQWTPQGGQPTNLATTFQSTGILQATVPASLLASPGTASVTVVNSATATSGAVTFTITPPPTPTLTSLTPASAVAGSGDLTMQLTGTNFSQSSAVQWTPLGGTGTNLVTTFQSATSIQAVVPAALLATPGTASVVVASSSTLVSSPQTFTINAPAVPVGLALAIPTPGVLPTDQPSITVTLSSPALADYTGTLQLNFAPASGVAGWPANQTNSQVVFAGGTNATNFTIARGATTGTVPNNGVFQQGTVAGTITAVVTTVNGAPLPAGSQPSVTQAVKAIAPVITAGSVQITAVSSTGFTVQLTAYSTTRDLTGATFTFQAANGDTLNGTTQTVSLNSIATTWFSSGPGLQAGGSFSLSVPFSYSGNPSALGGVSVTLTNSAGTSSAQSGQ